MLRSSPYCAAALVLIYVYTATASVCKLRCKNGNMCITAEQICDGVLDCPSPGEDEMLCSQLTTSMPYDCLVSESQICDGVYNCNDGRDERNCGWTTPPLVNLGNDWLWTWPLVGVVLCALVCTTVAVSLRFFKLKRLRQRQRLMQARAAVSHNPAASATSRDDLLPHPPAAMFSPPSYNDVVYMPYDCNNMGYFNDTAELPPDYLEAVREAEHKWNSGLREGDVVAIEVAAQLPSVLEGSGSNLPSVVVSSSTGKSVEDVQQAGSKATATVGTPSVVHTAEDGHLTDRLPVLPGHARRAVDL